MSYWWLLIFAGVFALAGFLAWCLVAIGDDPADDELVPAESQPPA